LEIQKTNLIDCIVLNPNVFNDDRGFFMELFQDHKYSKYLNFKFNFVQDNYSHSSRRVLRGLHFQKTKPQGKLIQVIQGEVFDIAVDLRRDSPSFGKWHSEILNDKNKKQFWIPPGFAHGFITISETADFIYKCTDYYDPNDEGCIAWNDPSLAIPWPLENPILSSKDQAAPFLNEIEL
tara:strand:+ start:68 stop:604 length:537 start_codon:yes stop_codon:yes gene_type:complete